MSILAAILALSFAGALPDAPPASVPKGHLVVVGGGGTTDAIVQKAIELAGGKGARMVVLAQASSRPEAGDDSVKFWKEKGLEHVASIDMKDEAGARAAIEKASLVWFPGGDQSRLVAALAKTSLPAAIRARYEAGAVVGGTSAGAAVMSSVMIVGGETADLTIVRSGTVLTAEGLGLWPETIVDQHFVRRQRFNRLLSAVLDRPELVGIGIDERTAVIVTGTSIEVVGESNVLVVDARGARVETKEEKAPPGAAEVKLSVLRAGMKLDLARPAPR